LIYYSITFPKSIKYIGESAFENDNHGGNAFLDIIFDNNQPEEFWRNNVILICENAFARNNIKSITLPDLSIGEKKGAISQVIRSHAFDDWDSSLRSITIANAELAYGSFPDDFEKFFNTIKKDERPGRYIRLGYRGYDIPKWEKTDKEEKKDVIIKF
jgi:hypothetical protein